MVFTEAAREMLLPLTWLGTRDGAPGQPRSIAAEAHGSAMTPLVPLACPEADRPPHAGLTHSRATRAADFRRVGRTWVGKGIAVGSCGASSKR